MYDKIIKDADNMLNGYYVFDGIWDMEPCEEPVNNKNIRWDIKYNNDKEWSYEFTRMDYLYKLVIAYEQTNDKKYINHGFIIINKWYKNNKKYLYKRVGKINNRLFKNLGHRSLDISIMISNILDYISYSKENNFITENEYNKYKNSILKIIDYIIPQADSNHKSFSNWGIIENGNILYCLNKLGIRNEDVESRLLRQINNQIEYNGSHIESSPMYLVQILLVLLKNINSNCYIKDELINTVEKSLEYIISIRDLNNNIPNIGDSDLTNISDLMLMAASILRDDTYLKYINKEVSSEYLFKYKKKYKINDLKSKEELIEYKNQTIYKNKELYLLCSNIPRRVDGHKHYDYMSVLYSDFGKDILVDLGRYTYKNDKDRELLKGPRGHNVISIDNKYYNYVDSWITSEKITPQENKVDALTIKMKTIFGYDITITRYVTYLKEYGLIISDIIDDKENNTYNTYFNIGPSFDIEEDNGIRIVDKNDYLIYHNDIKDNVNINSVKYSKRYNQFEVTKQLEIKTNSKNITHYFFKTGDLIKIKYEKDCIKYTIKNKTIIVEK